jgi:hypothetical protein
MATYIDTASGLNFRHIKGFEDTLLVDTSKIEVTLDYIKTHGSVRLELNDSWGFKQDDLSFLDGVEHLVKGLDVVKNKLNLEGIEKLRNLEYLRLTDELNQKVQFDKLKSLSYCVLNWNKVYSEVVFPPSITQLQLGAYKPQFGFNEEALNQLKNITKITLIQSTAKDISLLDSCGSLTHVDLAYCRALTDVSALVKHAESLIKLDIHNCKKIADFTPFNKLIRLQSLNLCGCKSIPSLAFLQNMPAAKHCVFYDTVVEDGDLSYLKGIDQVAFNNKAHYSLREKDFVYKWS